MKITFDLVALYLMSVVLAAWLLQPRRNLRLWLFALLGPVTLVAILIGVAMDRWQDHD